MAKAALSLCRRSRPLWRAAPTPDLGVSVRYEAQAFQGQPANCFVALDMANRMGASPMEIMQNVYVVHGTRYTSGAPPA